MQGKVKSLTIGGVKVWSEVEETPFDDSLILGRWTFNAAPTFSLVNAKTYNITFISNGETYDNIVFDWIDADSQEIKYGKDLGYLIVYSPDIYASSDGWINEYAKLIEITSVASLTKAQKQDLYGLLLTIAVKEQEEQEDELQGLWLMGIGVYGTELLVRNSYVFFQVDFQSEGQNFTSIKFELDESIDGGGQSYNIYYGNTKVGYYGSVKGSLYYYNNSSYRYIKITSAVKSSTNAGGYDLIEYLKLCLYATKIQEPLKGTWLWDDEIAVQIYKDMSINVQFMSNGTTYSSITTKYNYGTYRYNYLYYDDVIVTEWYKEQGDIEWVNDNYGTLTILDGITDIENGYDLLQLLQAYATKQETAPEYTFTYNSTKYTYRQGMTWEEYVESDYNSSGKFFGASSIGISTSNGTNYELVYNGTQVKGTDYVQSKTYSRGNEMESGPSPE